MSTTIPTLAWASAVVGSTWIIARAHQLPPLGRARTLLALTVVQALVGALWCWKAKVPSVGHPTNWRVLAVVLAGLQLAEHTLVAHAFPAAIMPGLAISSLLQSILFIGLVEELWFRGLWFHYCRLPQTASLALGSMAFGLYHWPHGPWVVLSTAGVGFAFAAARLRGASILGLGLTHGVNNWINQSLCPGRAFRVSREAVAFGIAVAGIAVGLWILRRRPLSRLQKPPAS